MAGKLNTVPSIAYEFVTTGGLTLFLAPRVELSDWGHGQVSYSGHDCCSFIGWKATCLRVCSGVTETI